MSKNKGKYRALLGVLVVFIVPFVVVSTVYLSNKPKTVTLGKLYNGEPFLTKSLESETGEQVNLSEFNEDIKILYSIDEVNSDSKLLLLKSIYDLTLTYPKPDFKDPFPVILFVEFDNSIGNNEVFGKKNMLRFQFSSVKDTIIQSRMNEQKVLLLGRANRVRGEYDFTKDSFNQLKYDLQNLMAETYFINKKTERENRLKKKL